MNRKPSSLPTFATNKPSEGLSVAEEVNHLLAFFRNKLKDEPDVSIATAYINPAGFNLLAEELEQAPRVRLLLGAEPDQEVVVASVLDEKGVERKFQAAKRVVAGCPRPSRKRKG